jgi:hypothetical protein
MVVIMSRHKPHHRQPKQNRPQVTAPNAGTVGHTMLAPGLAAVLAILGLGAGLGIALMLAKVLTYTGYAISLICAGLALWLYIKPLRDVAHSIKSRTAYQGPPSLREISIAIGLVLGVVVVASAVLPISLSEPLNIHKAFVQTKGIERVKIPADAAAGSIWARLNNGGDLDATDLVSLMKGHIANGMMTVQQASAELDAMEKMVSTAPKEMKTVLTKAQDQIVTLQDIDAAKWQEAVSGKLKPPELEFSDTQWTDFLQGKTVIYLFLVARYRDDSLNKGDIWNLRFCGYFVSSTTFWHNCSKNTPEKIVLK